MSDQKMIERSSSDWELQANDQPGKKPTMWVFLSAIIGFIYLLNPTFGILELIPDNLPFVGNLDEGAAAILAWQGIKGIIYYRKHQ